MFQVSNGMASLNKQRRLTAKQTAYLNALNGERREAYLLSLLGVTKRRVWVDRFKSCGSDSLECKPKGAIRERMERLLYVDKNHSPTTKHLGQWIGVEVECFIPHQDVDETGDCTDDCDHDNGDCYAENEHWTTHEAHRWLETQLLRAGVTRCNVKDDGSLSDDKGHGVEVTILFNSAYGFEPLERLCKALRGAGCYVNKTCGLHVHTDARHLKPRAVKAIGKSLGHALPVIKWLVPETRHSNNYCKLGVSAIRGDRYHAVNLTAFRKYKTIEVRLHSGTINAEKIINWVRLIKLIGAARLTKDLETFQDLCDLTGMYQDLIEYADKRITELNPTAWLKLMPMECSAWPRAQGPVVSVESTLSQLQGAA